MYENFHGNAEAQRVLAEMVRSERMPQTILLAGPEGIGKATLARRFAASLIGHAELIEQDDLSLDKNQEIIAEREKWTAEKRNEDPIHFNSHPDFVTFCPEGPLRQISIPQMRLLKERAQFGPLRGTRKVFLIDQIDRANEQAANSLLKTLEEPPEYLVIVATAANSYDLLPTIRSRAVPLYLSPLDPSEMMRFAQEKGLKDAERRVAIAGGSPGLAMSLDLTAYDKRRAQMMALLGASCGVLQWADWAKISESLNASRTERLENHLKVLYLLLDDLLLLRCGSGNIRLRNVDIRRELDALVGVVTFDWIQRAVKKTDELVELLRRNIQKGIALDSMVLELRSSIRL